MKASASTRNVTGFLPRLARACSRHRWIVIGAWVALLVGVNAVAGAVGPDFKTDFSFPESESKQVQELLQANSPDQAGFTAQIVARSERGFDDPDVRSTLEDLFAFVRSQGDITVTSPYDSPRQVGADGTIAFAQLDIADTRSFTELTDVGNEIIDYGNEINTLDGLQIEYGGDLFAEFTMPESEIYGLIAAVIILIVAFGSVLGMGLPIGTALFGLGVASALVTIGSHVVSMPDFTTAMVAMIGIGVGIDYALFIVTRYREHLRAGASVEDAIVASMDTSGRAVMFAGITVIIALMGLFLIGLNFVQGVAAASALGVLLVMASSLTLLPALLGWVGRRIEQTTWAALAAVGARGGRRHRRHRLGGTGDLRGRARRGGRPVRGELRHRAVATVRAAPPRGAARATGLVSLESLHPAPPVAERPRRRHRARRAGGSPAVAAPGLR